ncbi:hypothetical protein AB832_06740 [Flavobacteriaceae bacterium (ex Bugula neritina AB1)]|nr:hypothetical protein AB832_06740 [Flavobacteriaceae bacterium (ex Bugula neritina AB1)]
MNVEYPILPSYGDDPSEEDKENTIARYYGHQNRAGFFPVGMHNTWHGGIHIEDFGTDIRAIADGRIIAYRIPEDYFSEKDNEKNKFSNGFILIQHNFETPEKIKFQFYSLYMHLQPKTEMENSPNGRNIPDLYAKYTAKTRINVRETGLKIREYSEDDTTKSREVRFIPKGGLLKKDNTTPPKGHWMENNTQYVFCNHNGEILCAYKGWLKDYDDEHYQVHHLKAKDTNSFNTNAPKGTMLFNAIGGTYIGMECKDVTLEIETTKNKDWYKVKNTNNFILVKDCTALTKKIKNDVKFDSVENVDVPIKAGQIIGVPSKYEADNLKFYTTVHLEVFSDDKNLANFINNSKDKDRTSYEIAKDKTLQVAKPCNFLKANTKVKIYQTKDNYTQIGFEDVFCEAINGTDIVHKGKKQVYVNGKKVTKTTYLIKEDKFAEINNKLNNLLPNKDVLVYWSGKVSDSIRKIGFGTAQSGKKYWVNSNEVTGNLNQWVSLATDITAVYEKEPNNITQDPVIEKTIKVRKVTSTKDSDDNEWWRVKAKKQQGWIKKSELTEKNPYQWSDYGWKILENTGDQYFYMFGKLVEKSEPHEFIQQIWEQADTDGDKQLTNAELQNAVRNKEKLNLISKLICKHPNEWNTWKNISKFESELKQLFQKGINQAEGTDSDGNDLKQQLEQQRDQKVEMLKDKIEKLCFWDKIQTGDIVPVAERRKEYINKHKSHRKSMLPEGESKEETELGKKFDELEAKRTLRYFPTTDNVYHFHPIALIEHLKMIIQDTKDLGPWPVEENFKHWTRRIDSGVGKRHVKGIKTASKNHKGLDINFSGGGNTDLGAPIYATHDGFAHVVKDTTSGSGGRYIEIMSNDKKFMTRYMHLSMVNIEKGNSIKKGQKIGELGASYYGQEISDKMSAHLHYEIRSVKNNTYDGVIDPTEGRGFKSKPVELIDPQDWIEDPSLFNY